MADTNPKVPSPANGVKDATKENKIGLVNWAKNSPLLFGYPSEIVLAALPDGEYTQKEVEKAIEKHLKTPAKV